MIKKAYKQKMTKLKEEIRMNKVEKRKKREEREEEVGIRTIVFIHMPS